MKILAVRDDGAQLIGDNDLSCGMLRGPDGSTILPVTSILARGYWDEPSGIFSNAIIRPDNEAAIREASAEYDARSQ